MAEKIVPRRLTKKGKKCNCKLSLKLIFRDER